jgi:hypothetical protein
MNQSSGADETKSICVKKKRGRKEYIYVYKSRMLQGGYSKNHHH